MSRNDPEQALLALADYGEGPEYKRLIREIRATERRLTVEKVREAVLFQRTRLGTPPEKIRVTELLAILDNLATADVDEEAGDAALD